MVKIGQSVKHKKIIFFSKKKSVKRKKGKKIKSFIWYASYILKKKKQYQVYKLFQCVFLREKVKVSFEKPMQLSNYK